MVDGDYIHEGDDDGSDDHHRHDDHDGIMIDDDRDDCSVDDEKCSVALWQPAANLELRTLHPFCIDNFRERTEIQFVNMFTIS
jgi:hypothetical protein